MSQPAVQHAADNAIEPPIAEDAARQIVKHAAARPAARPRSLTNKIMWLVILWCAGFGVTFLVVLPFHLLVQWASHH
jgi:hypothetical protein